MNWQTDICLVCAALSLICAAACEDQPDPEPAGKPVDIRVDRPALDYLYRARDGRIRSAASLGEIPPELRGAVMVHNPDLANTDARPDTIYVANLFDAAPGDQVAARPSTRERYARRTADLRDARRLARWTALTAEEFAKFHPRSLRQRASEEAQRKFDELADRLADSPTNRLDDSADAGTIEHDDTATDTP
jgi:hypothetical protein